MHCKLGHVEDRHWAECWLGLMEVLVGCVSCWRCMALTPSFYFEMAMSSGLLQSMTQLQVIKILPKTEKQRLVVADNAKTG